MNKLRNIKISKNFMYFMILPLLIMLVGIVLFCTIGFNNGVDFKGGSTFKIYVNNDEVLTETKVYDLENKKDYQEVKDKVYSILNDNGLKIVSYRQSSMDISEYKVFSGQAVEVVYLNKAKGDDVDEENSSIRGQLLTEFNYTSYENAISPINQVYGHNAFNYSMEILAAIVVALAICIIYLLIRKYEGASLLLIMQTALDMILLLCLLVALRPVINMTIGIAFIFAFLLSISNSFIFLYKIKNGQKSGKYENLNSSEMADMTTKEMFKKKSIVYGLIALTTLLFVAIAVPAVRQLALALLIAVVATYYTSTFLLPGIWSVIYHNKHTKN